MEGQRFQGVNRDGEYPYFEDGVRVELAPFDHGDGEGPVTEFGTVRHDMGGENVPVYIDGKNTSLMPHDYTNTPRECIVASWAPEVGA